jgi:hypothetical protein
VATILLANEVAANFVGAAILEQGEPKVDEPEVRV